MNNRQRLAAVHARELRQAKEALQQSLNTEMSKQRQRGYDVSAAPQIQRLLGLEQYRLRDYNRIVSLANDPNKLREYVVAVDTDTGELVSGKAALARASRRVGKAAVRASVEAEPANEIDMMVDNVSETIADSFVDLSVLNTFEQYINGLLSTPEQYVDLSTIEALHPSWIAANGSQSQQMQVKVGYASRQMVRDNISKLFEIKSAIQRLISMEGEQEAARRIQENYGELQDASLTAAIGYEAAAASALQSVLKILLPSAVHDRAMRGAISTMQDTIESQWEDEMG